VSGAASSDVDRRDLVLRALRSPRARYSAERAAQLSGIPRSTIYDWQRATVYRPDFYRASPMMWSYRDLIYLRLLAWLRSQGMERPTAADRVAAIKRSVLEGERIDRLRSDGNIVLIDDEPENRFSGENVLPTLSSLFGEFDLLEPVRELGDRPLWGPDLVTPSDHTYISPWVLAGEPPSLLPDRGRGLKSTRTSRSSTSPTSTRACRRRTRPTGSSTSARPNHSSTPW
jgi:hypothetical protein